MEFLDLISQSALLKQRKAILAGGKLEEYVPVRAIQEAELVDAEAVIRCRDCFWFTTELHGKENTDIASPLCRQGFCLAWKGETRGDQFCSRARAGRQDYHAKF